MIINSSNISNLMRGFKSNFSTGFKEANPMWAKIATKIMSNTSAEDYSWLSDYPMLREWVGDRIFKDMESFLYSITNKTYEGSIRVKREKIEDDQYNVYGKLFEELGRASAQHPDELIFDLLKDGFSTECFDGQYFFDDDHDVAGSSVSNDAGGPGAPWCLLDTTRPLKPLIYQQRREYNLQSKVDLKDEAVFKSNNFEFGVDGRCNVGFGFWQLAYGSKQTLNAANVKLARAAMMDFKSANGRPLNINPNMLICGASNMDAAETVLDAQDLVGGGSNTMYKKLELVVSPYMTA